MPDVVLSDKEKKLIDELIPRLRQVEHGKVPVIIHQKNFQPMRMEVKGQEESIML